MPPGGPAGIRRSWWNGTNIVNRFYTKIFQMQKYSETSNNSTAGHTQEKSTSSPADSRASLFPSLESGQAQTTTVISGLRCLESLRRLNRSGLLAKTLLTSEVWTAGIYSPEYSLTWKMEGIARKYILFRLLAKERRTGGKGLGLLPTLKAGDGEFGLPRTSGRPPEKSTHLATRLRYAILPTLTARDYKSEKASPATMERNSRPLSETFGAITGLKLQPEFAEWMMGFPPGWTELENYPALEKKAKPKG